FMGRMASEGDELGIAEFPPEEWDAFRQSIHAVVQQISAASIVAVAPQAGEPQLANQATLLELADSAAFLLSAQELTTDWNRLIENAQREVELVFDTEPIDVAGLQGTRLAVDLPMAFKAEQVPEVRKVLTSLFGNTGEMQIDLLPLDAKHVI